MAESRLRALLEHFSTIEDPRDVRRILHPLPEILLLVVCGTLADCDDYEGIASWGEAHLPFLRRYLPYEHGVPGERWLTILMNRINPALFSAAFSDWVRETWPERPELVAIDGKTSRRSHDRAAGAGPLHLVSAFATTRRLVLGQEAVPDKANELAAIPVLLERLGAEDGLKGALVSIDAIATNADIATAIRKVGADYLLAVKANQPTLRAEIEAGFAAAEPHSLDTDIDLDKAHGRIEHRRVDVLREVDWLSGERRFPGELRLPGVACILRVHAKVELADRCRQDTRYFISSASLPPPRPPRPCADTGPSRTACTGSSTSPSAKTSPGSARDTVPRTWPSSDTSLSTSYATPTIKNLSNSAAKSPPGPLNTSARYSPCQTGNLDS
ncbi:putative transposase YbfD/YdcC [Inquilinus ginsengisoli]